MMGTPWLFCSDLSMDPILYHRFHEKSTKIGYSCMGFGSQLIWVMGCCVGANISRFSREMASREGWRWSVEGGTSACAQREPTGVGSGHCGVRQVRTVTASLRMKPRRGASMSHERQRHRRVQHGSYPQRLRHGMYNAACRGDRPEPGGGPESNG